MIVLALDTSCGIAVSVLVPGQEPHTLRVDEARQHAEMLAPLMSRTLAQAEVSADEVQAVVVGTGPAPFTGLRAGIVAARIFAFAQGIPVWGVPSLDALARQAFARSLVAAGQDFVALADARRREVYWARYTGSTTNDPSRLGAADHGPDVARPQQLAESGQLQGAVVASAGLIAAVEGSGVALVASDLWVDPADLAQLALVRHQRGFDLPTEPLYLRRPDAQVPATVKRAAS